MKYTVICANLGTVHETNNRKDAENVFNEYVQMSKDGYGRAAGEDVYLMLKDCTIIKEHIGAITQNEMES